MEKDDLEVLKIIFIYLFMYVVYTSHSGGQRSFCRNQVSPTNHRIPQMELKSLGLVPSAFTFWAISVAWLWISEPLASTFKELGLQACATIPYLYSVRDWTQGFVNSSDELYHLRLMSSLPSFSCPCTGLHTGFFYTYMLTIWVCLTGREIWPLGQTHRLRGTLWYFVF